MALVEYSVQKGIAILELNDPPANTYTYEMMRELVGFLVAECCTESSETTDAKTAA